MKRILSAFASLALLTACDPTSDLPDLSDGPDFIIDPIYTPYACRVVEYRPAPGQFVNILPLYQEGDTEEDMLTKATKSLEDKGLISLGSFGGYVTFCFDHPVENLDGADVAIYGNAFEGAAEPGIVMVSEDVNQNGQPDDPWYELQGSEARNSTVRYNYKVTYTRAEPEHDTPWTDSFGQTGFVYANSYHKQAYFPLWLKEDKLEFTGTLLPANATKEGTKYVLNSYAWGYVDNQPNAKLELNSFDISNAVDSEGHPVELKQAHFFRVYTAMLQDCGPIGETSTEVSYAVDLHMMAAADE